MSDIVERLLSRALPSAFDFVGNKVEALFDPQNRHKSGKKPFDYLASWLSMLRPFAYATRDDSWGEMEKLLCIVMRNYVEVSRDCNAAAAEILTQRDQLAALQSECNHWHSLANQRALEIGELRERVAELDASLLAIETCSTVWSMSTDENMERIREFARAAREGQIDV